MTGTAKQYHRWPFARTPEDVANDLLRAYEDFGHMLSAVRYVVIERGEPLASAATPSAATERADSNGAAQAVTDGSAVDQHDDDRAVDAFAAAMKAKLARKRDEGRRGWDDPIACPPGRLAAMLHEHLAKGDPVDIGNFAMMLWHRGESAALPAVAGDSAADPIGHTEGTSVTGGRVVVQLVAGANLVVGTPLYTADALERLARERDDVCNVLTALRAGRQDFMRRIEGLLDRAERAEAERDALRECVKAADKLRYNYFMGDGKLYDAARAKVKP